MQLICIEEGLSATAIVRQGTGAAKKQARDFCHSATDGSALHKVEGIV